MERLALTIFSSSRACEHATKKRAQEHEEKSKSANAAKKEHRSMKNKAKVPTQPKKSTGA
jgi:hypothetical protein